MTVHELVQLLLHAKQTAQVRVEDPESGGSISLVEVNHDDNDVVILVGGDE